MPISDSMRVATQCRPTKYGPVPSPKHEANIVAKSTRNTPAPQIQTTATTRLSQPRPALYYTSKRIINIITAFMIIIITILIILINIIIFTIYLLPTLLSSSCPLQSSFLQTKNKQSKHKATATADLTQQANLLP